MLMRHPIRAASEPTREQDAHDFLVGGGEMAALIRSKDWSRTPLGPIETWPQSLRTAASLCLASNFPINLIWGPEHTQIYNDGYRVVCGEAHPRALGEGYNVTWASAWPAIGPPFEQALAGETSFIENQRMFLTRNGYWEETFFTFSLSPIRDESGGIGGLFHPVTETTATMLAERRTRALRDLTSNLNTASTQTELAAKTIATVAAFDLDLPFALFYQLDAASHRYRLAASCGIAAGAAAAPAEIDPDALEPWPFAEAVRVPRLLEVGGARARFEGARCGPYDEPPDAAFVLPIHAPGADRPPIVVVVGASPRLPLNDAYRGLYELLAATISAAQGVVRAREDERRRAEALAEIDRAKTTFFSNVSHEFRTPLTLILGPIEDALSEDDDMSPSRRERLEIVRRNALRLLKLVNALLDFSRIEAGRMTASLLPTDLAAATADLASNFRSACERAGLELVVDCPPLSRAVAVDRDMWEKIVLNLISNAFKFTSAGRIAVSLRETETGVVLSVEDSGVGIPAEQLPRVFERFHRVEGQRGRTHEGTGIGLSLVRELVALHGGDISAESVEGEGATLRVTLPFGASEALSDLASPATGSEETAVRANAFVEEALRWLPDAEDARPERARAMASSSDPAGKPRVLLADDNADMRDYVRRMLEGGGYEVQATANGVLALAAARGDYAPDLVLCDVMMPELDGFGLLKALRADPALEGVPVIMLSARAGEEARIEGLAAGADDYLVKPFGARELRARIDGAIALARQRREAVDRERAIGAELQRLVAERTAELLDAVRKLGEKEAHFRALYRATPVMMHSVDREGRLVEINEAWAARMGCARADAIGRPLIEFVAPDERQRYLEASAPGFWELGSCDRIRHRLIGKDGVAFETEISAIVHFDGGKEQAFAVVVDVTEREAAETGLRKKALELEQVNEQLSQFSYVASHDLQEPLRKIVTFSNLLGGAIDKDDAEEIRYAASVMREAAARARRLVADLLALSRSAKAELRVEPLAMSNVVAVVLEDLSEAIRAAGAQIELQLGEVSVEGDRTQLVTLFTNLVSNAIKYRKPGQPPRVRLTARELGPGALEIAVEDDGIGFEAAHRAVIFEPFKRLHATSEYPGSGIGLAICRTIADRHGWSIAATSAPGQGSRFVVEVTKATDPSPSERDRAHTGDTHRL